MSEKDGHSEEKVDFWGNSYTQHYDSNGNKSGYSEEKESFFGNMRWSSFSLHKTLLAPRLIVDC